MSEIPAWNGAASPAVKFEGSPTESVLSAPDEMYPSLFSPSPASTIHPLDVLSPPASTCGDSQSTPAPTMTTTNITPPAITPALTPALPPSLAANLPADLSMLAAGISALTQNALTQPPPPTITASDSEKKPVKKRKSWGQVLPEPKTNLPPRYVTMTIVSNCRSHRWLTFAKETRQDRR
jgi:transcriptional activator HAC1